MKIICIGRNYLEHAKELNSETPSKPLFFLKPDSAILPKKTPFYIPDFSSKIHYECEVVLKICKVGKHIQERFAHNYFSEIGLGLDFTARDLQEECKAKGLPWEISKAFDGSAVVSEKFIPKNELDVSAIPFSLKLNDKIVQQSSTDQMLFSFEKIITHVSQFMTLKIGDLIYTGTPAGVGEISIGDSLIGEMNQLKMFQVQIK